ncbi:MAG: M60 family metallopeptidase [Roseburia sp.]|nr:M60 family metallopeptidase [Anaeroplasma bactoclasticum]MCM1196610.1 M60 family metallopeptidase [Roseburia sp.]MCM1557243.1 M60 family metallopeptidase [Anaeroplasma bactoclasticum]
MPENSKNSNSKTKVNKTSAENASSVSKTTAKATDKSNPKEVKNKTASTKQKSTDIAQPEKKVSVEEASPKTSSKPVLKEKSTTKKDTPKKQNDSKKSVNKNSNQEEKSNKSLDKNKLISILSILGFVIVIGLVITIVLSVRSCSNSNEEYTNPYKAVTKVGYETEVLGTVKRKSPRDTKNEGRSTIGYPKYGSTLKESIGTSAEKVALRNVIIGESNYLTSNDTRNAGGGGYNRMDAFGNLFLNEEPVLDAFGNQRYLYKHTASEGLYLGNVSDDEPGIIKRITMLPRGYDSYSVTGVYAPAGEVIKVEISKEDMEATDGIIVHIGQALYNRKANNIWATKNIMNRMPHILNTMVVTKDTATLNEEKGIYTAYVGSFLGGPVYIHNENVEFSVTISGAVKYSHFILGFTTPEEFAENAKSTAPYFDLEVWENGVLHSGPNYYAKQFGYDELYDAAILWEKISLVSTQVRKQGIVFLYDPFVAAGAAVAFPGQYSVNCPMSWMPSSLNYKAFVNGGAWGNMHEYNHNFQGFGVGNGGEVTNNSLNLVSYSLFTSISSGRKIGTVSEGLGGWNAYTNASWALREITENRYSNGKQGLAIYANMLHSFGQDIYMQSVKTSGGQSVDKWFTATMNASHYDMTYFYKDLIGYTITDSVLENAKATGYPMFVPVASIYQTGRGFTYNGETKYSETMQPYKIAYGTEYEFDLGKCVFDSSNIYQGGSIVLPNGFSYQIKNVSQPEHGTILKVDGKENIYKFKPDTNLRSGKFIVTLEITKDDNAFEVEDVELVMEFEQSHEMNKTTIERTTYTFDEDKMYTSATQAFEANYAGYKDKVEGDNQNPYLNGRLVQNCNSDVWYTEDPGTNCVVEIKGKLLADEVAKYRIALRGRYNCALYTSLDGGKTYELAATYIQSNSSSPDFPLNVEGTYKDYELETGDWVYYKAVLLTNERTKSNLPFIGVGWGKFTPEAPILDAEGNEIGMIPESVIVSYANGYRQSYEAINTPFESEYHYLREYGYDYKDNSYFKEPATLVTSANYTPYDKNRDKIENLVDGNLNTYIHTNFTPTAQKPLVFVVDLGKEFTANQMTLFTQYRPNGDYHIPTEFLLEGSLDGTDYFRIGNYQDVKRTNTSIIVNFDEEQTFRYYRLTITKATQYVIITEIQFANLLEINGGHHISLDSQSVTMKGKWNPESILSSFGHVYYGKKKSTIEYEFEGTRFGVLSSSKLSLDFVVYIDGKKMESIDLKEDTGIIASFISSELKEGKHKVIIECVGNANIDSIVYWD